MGEREQRQIFDEWLSRHKGLLFKSSMPTRSRRTTAMIYFRRSRLRCGTPSPVSGRNLR